MTTCQFINIGGFNRCGTLHYVSNLTTLYDVPCLTRAAGADPIASRIVHDESASLVRTHVLTCYIAQVLETERQSLEHDRAELLSDQARAMLLK